MSSLPDGSKPPAIARVLAASFLFLRNILLSLFGRLAWTPPAWASLVDRAARSGVGIARSSYAADPARFTRRAGIAALAVFASVLAYTAWKSLPKPAYLPYSLVVPGPTPLVKDAKPTPLVVVFEGSAAPLDMVGKRLESGIGTTPVIEGEWQWESDRRLVFNPAADWPVDEEIVIDIGRDALAPQALLERYRTSFRTARFDARISGASFHEDPSDPRIKKVVATLKFTHPVDKPSLERAVKLTLRQQGLGFLKPAEQQIGFTVQYDDFAGEAYVHSLPLSIPDKDASMLVQLGAGTRSSRGGAATSGEPLQSTVTVPGMYSYFRIDSFQLAFARNDEYDTEQVGVIETTAAVDQSELRRNVKIYRLPVDRPAFQGREAVRNYHWWNPAEIGTEILAKSEELALDWIPSESDHGKVHSFRYKAPVGSYFYARIAKGVRSVGDYVLSDEFGTVLKVQPFPKELRIMHEGALLSISGDKKLSVMTRDVQSVKIEMSRVFPASLSQLVSQTQGTFQRPDFVYSFSEDNISELFSEIRDLPPAGPGRTSYTTLDFSALMTQGTVEPRGLFLVKLTGWDRSRNAPTGIEDRRLVMLTDMGLLVKQSLSGEQTLFVHSFRSRGPVEGATVEVIGANGLAVLSAASGPDGRVTFPKLNDFKRDKRPVLYAARMGDDVSFIPIGRDDRKLNFSRFDVGGVSSNDLGQHVQAYLFTDRGIYRPGDPVHVGLILKANDWKADVTSVPLELSIVDPRGMEIDKRRIRFSPEGFEEIDFPTRESSLTGTYQFNLYIMKDQWRTTLLGSTQARVEEFLPDRMKISSGFSRESKSGWVNPKDLEAYVDLRNLFGTPAVGRVVRAKIGLFPAFTGFREYPGYVFHDPLRAKKSFSEDLAEAKTDESGRATLAMGLERFEKATYRLVLSAEGFESEGGRAVATQSAQIVSPLAFLVGYKPDGDLGYVSKGSARRVSIVAVGPDLGQLEVKDLALEIAEARFVSVLTKQPNGTFAYQSVRRETVKKREDITIPAAGLDYELPTGEPGTFVLIVRDSAGTEMNRVEYTVAGAANLTGRIEADAELQIRLNKADYAQGEEIELQITAPYTGSGLITIEKEKIYAWQWFHTDSTSSVHRIRLPEELEGNGYVNVSFVRSLDSREVYLSPLSYGVAPFSVSRERRVNALTLDVPERVRPGETLTIGYGAAKPGKLLVYLVDEGILQVARYRTPAPLPHFMRKRSLEVSTSQILDLLLPEFELVRSLSAPGGDGEGELGRNLNPFKRKRDKPVVFWSGLMNVGSGTGQVSYEVPDYFNGTARVMAVIVSEDSIGVAEEKTYVRGDFVISPNVPLVLTPGDEAVVTASVANNLEGTPAEDEISLTLDVSDGLELLDGGNRVARIAKGREESLSFRVRARQPLGSATLAFRAASGGHSSRLSTDLSVRPATPKLTVVSSGYMRKGKGDLPVTRRMYPDFRLLEASASTVPLGLAKGVSAYLRSFPYACTEQLVSQAFTAMLLRDRPEFGYVPAEVDQQLDQLIAVLWARQNAEGAFGFWAANSHMDPYQSVYAMHFLTDALARGRNLPRGLTESALEYLRGLSTEKPDSLSGARLRAYAMYVLARNGRVPGAELQTLRELLDKAYRKEWRNDLTAVYLAATYRMLQMSNEAGDLVRSARVRSGLTPDYAAYYDPLSHAAQVLYLLSRHFPERLPELGADDILGVAEPLRLGEFNTLTGAYSVAALDAYASAVGLPAGTGLSIEEILGDGSTRTLAPRGDLFAVAPFSEGAKSIRFSGSSDNYLFYQTVEEGFDLELPGSVIKQGLEVTREIRNEKNQKVSEAALGEKLDIWLSVRSLDGRYHPNVALVDLLPAGFEVELASAGARGTLGGGSQAWRPDYVDIREDRVVLFGTVGDGISTYVYRIRAANKGKFSMPPAYAESMYDRSLKARALGAVLEVR